MTRFRILLICSTPLHCIVALRVFALRNINLSDCFFVYHSEVDDSKHRKYYEKISVHCKKSLFINSDKSFYRKMTDAIEIFSGISCDDVYFASPNHIYVQMALSMINQKRIYTFDDGTANIYKSSPFNRFFGLPILNMICSIFYGNRYFLERIKGELIDHFSIYHGIKNNMSIKYNEIDIIGDLKKIKIDNENVKKQSKCVVFLGGVYEEMCSPKHIKYLFNFIYRIFENVDSPIFYIPHPRERLSPEINANFLYSDLIAEEIIINLLSEYEEIDVYGFYSSAQLSMASIDNIKNFCIYFDFEYLKNNNRSEIFGKVLGDKVYFLNGSKV